MLALGAATASDASTSTSEPLNLEQYKGRVVYLDFWASWCGPCKQSFPYMKDLSASNAKNGLVIIAVNVDHDRKKADYFLEQFDNNLKVVYDPKGEIASKYNVREMPTSLLIDKAGRVRFVHKGFFENQTATYDSQALELLHEKQ